MSLERAFLLIADIGGYTRFMKVHRINLAHAQDVVAQLLEAVIDGGAPVLKLSKLEGDAALFYATMPANKEPDFTAVARAIADIRRAFLERRAQMVIDRMCTCDGCTQAGELKLKFVAHFGEVYFQKVKRFTELAGVDVIVVHRLLKNHVTVPEYVLMTDVVAERIPAPIKPHTHPQEEDLEGIGKVQTYFVDMAEIAVDLPEMLKSSTARKLWALMKMNWRAVPYLLGAKKACEGFRNVEGLAAPRLTSESAPPPAPAPDVR